MLKQWFFVVFIIIALCVLIPSFQRYFIYFPSKEKPIRSDFQAEDMQEIPLETSDGLQIYAWYKSARDQKPVIVYMHGNGGHIGYRMRLGRELLDAGFGLLLLEYRGYGGNTGKPTEQGLYADARAALQYLQTQKPHGIVLLGQSLGTGVATKMALEFPVCALILQSPYTTLTAVARYHYPWIPLILGDKYDSLGRIKKIQAPLLILHGSLDTVVPFTQGQALYEQANQPKAFQSFVDRNHNNLWDKNYVSVLEAFILKYCKTKESVTGHR